MVVTEKDEAKYVYLPWEKVTDPHGYLCEVFKKQWWIVHPEKGLVFWEDRNGWKFPQTNKDFRAFDRGVFPDIPGLVLRHIPMALVSRGENGRYFF